MATSREYFEYVFEQLSPVDNISYKQMMGEYILYCGGKIFGGIYDDRFLVKDVKSARDLMPDAPSEPPYDGAKPMLLVEELDDKEFLRNLVVAMADELPAPKKKNGGKK